MTLKTTSNKIYDTSKKWTIKRSKAINTKNELKERKKQKTKRHKKEQLPTIPNEAIRKPLSFTKGFAQGTQVSDRYKIVFTEKLS